MKGISAAFLLLNPSEVPSLVKTPFLPPRSYLLLSLKEAIAPVTYLPRNAKLNHQRTVLLPEPQLSIFQTKQNTANKPQTLLTCDLQILPFSALSQKNSEILFRTLLPIPSPSVSPVIDACPVIVLVCVTWFPKFSWRIHSDPSPPWGFCECTRMIGLVLSWSSWMHSVWTGCLFVRCSAFLLGIFL